MTKHTPGPWTIRPRPARYPLIGNGAQIWSPTVHVASMSTPADKPIDQKIADAHLIAAAPDLLEAAKKFVAFVDAALLPDDEVTAALRAAIAKAEALPTPAEDAA